MVLDLIRQTAQEAGIRPRVVSDEEILERCLYSLINEGARVLEDGTAAGAVDLDVIYLTGYGFPAWRGGPMFHAGLVGLNKICARSREFAQQHGARWNPAPLLGAAGGGRQELYRLGPVAHRLSPVAGGLD